MRVRAKHRFNYGKQWVEGGQELEISTMDLDMLKGMVEIVETPIPGPEETERRADDFVKAGFRFTGPEEKETAAAEEEPAAPKRGRPRRKSD